MPPLHLYAPHQTYIIFSKPLIPESFSTMRTLAYNPLNNCPFFFQYILNIILQCYFPLLMELRTGQWATCIDIFTLLEKSNFYFSLCFKFLFPLSCSSPFQQNHFFSHLFFSDYLYLFWHLNPYSAVHSWSTPSLNTGGCGPFQLLQKQKTPNTS